MGGHGLNAHLFLSCCLQRFVSPYNESMKLLLTILMLVSVVGCGYVQKTEDRTNTQSERYADFSYSFVASSVFTPDTSNLKKTKVAFTFTPSKFGAFMIVAGSDQKKLVLTDGDFDETVFEFGPVELISVYWSDGKQIERTDISVKYE